MSSPAETGGTVINRFASIVAADIAGYSRLMELDEAGTFARVQRMLHDIIEPAVADAGGRVVKTTGDGVIAECPGAREAVACALAIQARNEASELTGRPDRRARLRVGVHAGEVIAAGGDLFGEGVNIASRLEGIAGVGEVYVSEIVAQQAGPDCVFLDLGERRLKNISRPLRVFRAAYAADERAGSGAGAGPPDMHVQGFGDRPAIAVLPFQEPEAEAGHFASGVTDGVISALAQWHSFPVISRNSVYAMVALGPLDVRLAGQQLGVRYVIEGTLRRVDGRLRATVSLIDVDTDTGLLNETFECAVADMFTMQDDVVRSVVGRLEPALLLHERQRVAAARPTNPNVYELVQLAVWHHYKFDRANNVIARDTLHRALEAEPGNMQATTTLAHALAHAAIMGWTLDRDMLLDQARALAERAVALAGQDPAAHFALGAVLQNTARPADALQHYERALQLNPSHAAAYANRGCVLCFLDRPDEALPPIELAFRLSPSDPRRFMWRAPASASHYLAGRFRPALASALEALSMNPDYPMALRYATAALGAMDRPADAAPMVARLRAIDGTIEGTAAYLRRTYVDSAAARLMDGIRRAGFR